MPFYAPWGQLTSEAKFSACLLRTKFEKWKCLAPDSDLKEAQRVVPEYRLNGSLFMDNNQRLLGGYTQTLEPRMQYLYIPKSINRKYTVVTIQHSLQSDYYGLFRDMKYSSVDFIAPANQLSYGATSRL